MTLTAALGDLEGRGWVGDVGEGRRAAVDFARDRLEEEEVVAVDALRSAGAVETRRPEVPTREANSLRVGVGRALTVCAKSEAKAFKLPKGEFTNTSAKYQTQTRAQTGDMFCSFTNKTNHERNILSRNNTHS